MNPKFKAAHTLKHSAQNTADCWLFYFAGVSFRLQTSTPARPQTIAEKGEPEFSQ